MTRSNNCGRPTTCSRSTCYTPLTLADTLVIAGKPEEAKPFFDAAIQLAPIPGFARQIHFSRQNATGDIKALLDPKLSMPAEMRTALLMGYRATESGNAAAKAQAVQALLALREDLQVDAVAWLLADLGATHDAFRIASRLAAGEYSGPSIFWHPSMRGTLSDPGFPALAKQLGLIKYWKATKPSPMPATKKARRLSAG